MAMKTVNVSKDELENLIEMETKSQRTTNSIRCGVGRPILGGGGCRVVYQTPCRVSNCREGKGGV